MNIHSFSVCVMKGNILKSRKTTIQKFFVVSWFQSSLPTFQLSSTGLAFCAGHFYNSQVIHCMYP